MEQSVEQTSKLIGGFKSLFDSLQGMAKAATQTQLKSTQAIYQELNDLFSKTENTLKLYTDITSSMQKGSKERKEMEGVMDNLNNYHKEVSELFHKFDSSKEMSSSEADKIIDTLEEISSSIDRVPDSLRDVKVDIPVRVIDVMTQKYLEKNLSLQSKKRSMQDTLGFLKGKNLIDAKKFEDLVKAVKSANSDNTLKSILSEIKFDRMKQEKVSLTIRESETHLKDLVSSSKHIEASLKTPTFLGTLKTAFKENAQSISVNEPAHIGFSAAISGMFGPFGVAVDELLGVSEKLSNVTNDLAKTSQDKVGSWFSNKFQGLKASLTGDATIQAEPVKVAPAGFDPQLDILERNISEAFEKMDKSSQATVDAVKDVKHSVDHVDHSVKAQSETIGETLAPKFDDINKGFKTLGSKLKGMFAGLAATVKDNAGGGGGILDTALGTIFGNKAGGILSGLGGAIAGKGGILGKLGGALTVLGGAGASAGGGLVSAGGGLVSAGGGMLSKMGGAAVGGIKAIGGKIPLIGGLLTGGLTLAQGGSVKEAVGSGVGSAGGSVAGAALGTLIAPGIGTAIGAIAGGLIGEYFGKATGKFLEENSKANEVRDKNYAEATKASDESTAKWQADNKDLLDVDAYKKKMAEDKSIGLVDSKAQYDQFTNSMAQLTATPAMAPIDATASIDQFPKLASTDATSVLNAGMFGQPLPMSKQAQEDFEFLKEEDYKRRPPTPEDSYQEFKDLPKPDEPRDTRINLGPAGSTLTPPSGPSPFYGTSKALGSKEDKESTYAIERWMGNLTIEKWYGDFTKTPEKQGTEKGFFEKVFEGINSSLSNAWDKVKSFFGGEDKSAAPGGKAPGGPSGATPYTTPGGLEITGDTSGGGRYFQSGAAKGGYKLGDISSMYESGGDAGKVGKIAGDKGGYSYGAFQLASGSGGPEDFLKSVHGQKYAKDFEGAGSSKDGGKFKEKWEELGKKDQEGFKEAQRAYALEKYLDPMKKQASGYGLDISSRSKALQEQMLHAAMAAPAVGKKSLKAVAGKLDLSKASDKEIMDALHAEITKPGANGQGLANWSSQSAATQDSVKKAWDLQQKDFDKLLALEQGGGTKLASGTSHGGPPPVGKQASTVAQSGMGGTGPSGPPGGVETEGVPSSPQDAKQTAGAGGATDKSGFKAGGGAQMDKVNSDFLNRFSQATAEYKSQTGRVVQVTDGWRSFEKQKEVAKQKGKLAATPGKSMHGYGFAIDANSGDLTQMDKMGILAKYGLTRPMSYEPWHVEPQGLDKDALRAQGPSGFKGGDQYGTALAGGTPAPQSGSGGTTQQLAQAGGTGTSAGQTAGGPQTSVSGQSNIPSGSFQVASLGNSMSDAGFGYGKPNSSVSSLGSSPALTSVQSGLGGTGPSGPPNGLETEGMPFNPNDPGQTLPWLNQSTVGGQRGGGGGLSGLISNVLTGALGMATGKQSPQQGLSQVGGPILNSVLGGQFGGILQNVIGMGGGGQRFDPSSMMSMGQQMFGQKLGLNTELMNTMTQTGMGVFGNSRSTAQSIESGVQGIIPGVSNLLATTLDKRDSLPTRVQGDTTLPQGIKPIIDQTIVKGTAKTGSSYTNAAMKGEQVKQEALQTTIGEFADKTSSALNSQIGMGSKGVAGQAPAIANPSRMAPMLRDDMGFILINSGLV